jgi:hypothetical protein
MKRNLIIYCVALFAAALSAGCVKVIPKFNSNNITVTFNAPTATYLTANKTVNGKDSLDFSYTVTSSSPMTNVTLVKNGTPVYSDSVKTPGHFTFSGVKKFLADTAAGQYAFQVFARDANNIYIGSSSTITVTVNPDFYFYVSRRLYVPDSTNKTNPCFINLATGTTYSYSDVTAANNSANIDLGYFFSTDTVNTGTAAAPVKTAVGHTFYAPSSTPVTGQRAFYDLSNWTKNATQIAIGTSPTFATLLSGGGLKSAGLANLKTPVSSLPTYTPGLGVQSPAFKPIAAGSVIFFKTAAGKYGAINVLYVNQNNATHSTYVNFDYKIQY